MRIKNGQNFTLVAILSDWLRINTQYSCVLLRNLEIKKISRKVMSQVIYTGRARLEPSPSPYAPPSILSIPYRRKFYS